MLTHGADVEPGSKRVLDACSAASEEALFALARVDDHWADLVKGTLGNLAIGIAEEAMENLRAEGETLKGENVIVKQSAS